MVMEALVYILTLLFGVSTVIIIKNKRYKVVPFICLDIILTFAGFAITSFVILFVGNEALEALLIMSVFGLFLFLLGVNDIYAVFCCNQKIEAIYCGYNSYPGRYGITSYAPVFEYVCNGTAYHEQTTLTVPYRLLRRMTEGNTYPIYIHSKHPGDSGPRRLGHRPERPSPLGRRHARPHHQKIRHRQPLRSAKGIPHPDPPPDLLENSCGRAAVDLAEKVQQRP